MMPLVPLSSHCKGSKWAGGPKSGWWLGPHSATGRGLPKLPRCWVGEQGTHMPGAEHLSLPLSLTAVLQDTLYQPHFPDEETQE